MAVFSNQGDPFPTETRTRTHYHPSSPRALTEAQKQTVLRPLPHHLSDALSPPDLRFLVGSQRLVPGPPDSDSSEPFDESWPSTEGSGKTPEREEETDRKTGPGPEESVLARYIERFRSGRPTSRRERSPPRSGLKDFWWLQESPESPEVPRFRPDSGTSAPLESSPHFLERTPTLEEISLNDSSRLCAEDVDIAGLQLRAGKLIQRSESSLSSGGPVSSEGLGSPASTVSSSECDGSRRRPPDTAPVASVLRPYIPSTRAHPTALPPEEDILYQWRLRRKMEQAREGTLHDTSRKHSPSPPVRIPRQVLRTDVSASPLFQVSPQGAAPGSLVPSQPHTPAPLASPCMTPTSSVPPHLHLLCDVLPCARSQNVVGAPRVTQEAEPVPPPLPARPRTPPSERQIQDKKKKGARRKRDKKDPGHSRGPAPESPVHQAMEQVISERLFSPLPSPKSQRREQRPSTPSTEDDADLQALETAARLLEEAEDSDGADFADDPLLLVLRGQREALRSGLRALDSRLVELEKREL